MIRSFSLALLVGAGLVGSVQAETKTFTVGDFSEIDVSAGINVEFSTGQAPSAIVENRKGDFSDIDVSVRGDTLVIKRTKDNWGWGWGRRAEYNVTVTANEISGIEASSGSDVRGAGMRGDTVRIDVSSGADVEVKDIVGTTVILETSSGSDLYAEGECQTVRADSSSGSDIVAKGLKCVAANAEASSGSDISVYATSSLNADASSGADISVYGGPTEVNSDKSSGGSVDLRG